MQLSDMRGYIVDIETGQTEYDSVAEGFNDIIDLELEIGMTDLIDNDTKENRNYVVMWQVIKDTQVVNPMFVERILENRNLEIRER